MLASGLLGRLPAVRRRPGLTLVAVTRSRALLCPDASALVAALTQFSHLAADTIVNGGATSHLAPTDPADRKWAPGWCQGVLVVDQGKGGACRQALASNPGPGRMWVLPPGSRALALTALFPQAWSTPAGSVGRRRWSSWGGCRIRRLCCRPSPAWCGPPCKASCSWAR